MKIQNIFGFAGLSLVFAGSTLAQSDLSMRISSCKTSSPHYEKIVQDHARMGKSPEYANERIDRAIQGYMWVIENNLLNDDRSLENFKSLAFEPKSTLYHMRPLIIDIANCTKGEKRIAGSGSGSAISSESQSNSRTTGATSGNSNSSGSHFSNEACRQKIIAIQQSADAQVRSQGDNAIGRVRALYVANQAQKELFEGQCASHPQARQYVSSAEQSMREWGAKCQEFGGTANCGAGSAQQAGTSNGGANSGQAQASSRGPSTKGNYVESVTSCVKYQALHRQNETMQWFSFTNTCNIPIEVHYADTPNVNRFGSLSDLAPGQSSESWFDLSRVSSIKYIACPAKMGGKDVYLAEKPNAYCHTY